MVARNHRLRDIVIPGGTDSDLAVFPDIEQVMALKHLPWSSFPSPTPRRTSLPRACRVWRPYYVKTDASKRLDQQPLELIRQDTFQQFLNPRSGLLPNPAPKLRILLGLLPPPPAPAARALKAPAPAAETRKT